MKVNLSQNEETEETSKRNLDFFTFTVFDSSSYALAD